MVCCPPSLGWCAFMLSCLSLHCLASPLCCSVPSSVVCGGWGSAVVVVCVVFHC